ncbi:UNVERIFIED_CONTAM: hypothetical protein PYX00_010304 [Menopon gallinae]|uniref:MENTAL domain-containing protein n=1 Tax=Menopon gallinae TaxID=328185 RepID=A0AAW2HEW4_9NEOP
MTFFNHDSWQSMYKGYKGRCLDAKIEGAVLKHLPPNIETTLCQGSNQNRYMSIIRQYFCLFVLVDLVFHSLIYLQYLKHVEDYKLTDLIGCQMNCYSIETSLIDLLLFSFGRFVLLEASYGLGKSDCWVWVGLTTALTTFFSIIKTSYYQWANDCLMYWPISMIILSVMLAWVETFIIEYRVLKLENLAIKYATAIRDLSVKELPRCSFFPSLLPITKGLCSTSFF